MSVVPLAIIQKSSFYLALIISLRSASFVVMIFYNLKKHLVDGVLGVDCCVPNVCLIRMEFLIKPWQFERKHVSYAESSFQPIV